MTPQETVTTLMNAIQAGDFKSARSLLSTDFHFSGSVPDPLGAGPWIGLSANLRTAFPNLNYHFGIQEVVDCVVKISTRLTGTHTGTLDLTALQMGMIPASGKRFSMAYQEAEVTVRDQQVSAWKVQASNDAGLMTLLAQLTSEGASNSMRPQKRLLSVVSTSRWDDALKALLANAQKGPVSPHG
jgi:hypothetical protein